MILLKLINESISQAIHQLISNKLRSFLSLLGITIGIFCIIAVKSAVDSLEDNIRGSFSKLGSNVIYVNRFAWAEPPHNNWWKILRRPSPDFEDYKAIKKRSKTADMISMSVGLGSKTLKYLSFSVENVDLLGVTDLYNEMFNIEFEKGRFFSSSEYYYSSPKVVIGYTVAEELFGNIEPIGKKIKVMGKKMEIIGIVKKSGKDLINPVNFDEVILLPYGIAKTMANLKSKYNFSSTINVKAAENVSMTQMKDELTGILRSHRRLKPTEEDDFSLNQLTMLSAMLDGFFKVLNIAGLIIGIFAIFVGMFSVANIMFVSVKERTNIIGIKKALGAKNYIIVMEFLIEAIILCVLGGIVGLLIIMAVFPLLTMAFEFSFSLSWTNALIGLGVSVFIGILAGIIPAIQASLMDPVEAIRSK